MSRMRLRFGAIGLTALACASRSRPDDAAIRKQLLGIWECAPRNQLPPEKIDDVSFVTASFVAVQLQPGSEQGGEYVHVRREPASKNEPERFIELRGTWYVIDGNGRAERVLYRLQGAPS